MIRILIIAGVACLVGCGQVKDLGQGLIDAPSEIAKDFLRLDKDDDAAQEEKVKELTARVEALETLTALHNRLININIDTLASYDSEINMLDSIVMDLSTRLTYLTEDVEDFKNFTWVELEQLKSSILDLEQSIEILEGLTEYAVVQIIDPCGDKVGHFDEVVLKINDGSYLAYFEQGSRRFLSLLEYGKSYYTTDKQKCFFDIDDDGTYRDEIVTIEL